MIKPKINKSSTSSNSGKLSVRVKTAKGRKASSTRWLQRQLNDPFVDMAKEKGYASRAAFKLIEIDEKFNLLGRVTSVIDLGSAPGSWSQVLSQIPSIQNIIAVDLLEMTQIDRVHFIQGDFRDETTQNSIVKILANKKLDLIISDMAPNMLGHKQTDHLRVIALAEEVIHFAMDHLNNNGHLVIKSFHGGEFSNIIGQCKAIFEKIVLFKPKASRSDSSEIYMVCLKFDPTARI